MDSRDADPDTEFGVYIVIIDADIQKRSWEQGAKVRNIKHHWNEEVKCGENKMSSGP